MDRRILWQVALVQSAAVAALSLVLAVSLGHAFFVDWGWLVGPAAWALCALLVSRVLQLAPAPVLAGAALAGVPSVLAVIVGVHWLGAVVAVGLFALWCAGLEPRAPASI
ncbi:MAG: hypothetical protein ACR2ND_00395 [Solirubrobacteraceae bacterium]